jgi:dipeptidyl-peptidase-4
MIEDNHLLTEKFHEYPEPILTFDSLKAEDGTTLYSFMIKPHDFDPAKKYPLLIYTYGGPTSQIVTNRWMGERGLWYQYLTGELSVIIAGVDNRGSINRGKDFLAVNYLHLGTVEPGDQIHAAKIWGQLPYIDSDRIAIWGWSYGGINTLLSLCKFDGPDVFKMGIAVAPVVSWELYDTIYTERYLLTPGENPTGYFEASPVNYVQNLRSDQYLLLIHGTLDDNVHFQNSIRLIQALERANKPFHLMIYPGANHGMGRTGNQNTKLHLYQTITNFLKEYL